MIHKICILLNNAYTFFFSMTFYYLLSSFTNPFSENFLSFSTMNTLGL